MLFELFLSGEWKAIEFGLAVIGALCLGRIIYRALLKERVRRIKEKEVKETTKKYFD